MGLHVSLFKEVASVKVPSEIVGALSDELNGRYAEYCEHVLQKAHDLVVATYSLDESYRKSLAQMIYACGENPRARLFVKRGGSVSFTKEVYADTTPHAFGPLAIALGAYDALWGLAHEDWQECVPAISLVKSLNLAAENLKSAKESFSRYGSYVDVFEKFLCDLSEACQSEPKLMFTGKIV